MSNRLPNVLTKLTKMQKTSLIFIYLFTLTFSIKHVGMYEYEKIAVFRVSIMLFLWKRNKSCICLFTVPHMHHKWKLPYVKEITQMSYLEQNFSKSPRASRPPLACALTCVSATLISALKNRQAVNCVTVTLDIAYVKGSRRCHE